MSKKQEDIIKEIKQAYMITFSSKEGKIVLEDLEKRTGVHNTTFDKDPYVSANLEGMRAVTLFIKQMLEEKK
jgi:hypothetical protein|tara:strand:+ start:390 stop:605 length:216 start_codon:yes stop_codon:yes gene_type:complete